MSRTPRLRGDPNHYLASREWFGMSYRSTFGWSLVSAGAVTLLLAGLPGDSIWWGAGLLLAGLVVLVRRT